MEQNVARSQNQSTRQNNLIDLTTKRKKPPLYSQYFRRYELMIEFTNLRNPKHCPSGVYIMPAIDDMNTWYGVLFVRKGYYKNGVFKFRINIPREYPERAPGVAFITDMFHPLVDQNGQLSIGQQFPTWTPNRDYIFHVLHYVRNIFKKVALDGLMEKYCLNKEAYRMYRNEVHIFAKLAQQCAQLSITESILYDNYPESNTIRFNPLSDTKFEELKTQILSNNFSSIAESTSSSDRQLKDRLRNLTKLISG
ncbi:uncharacterized protein VTP21DRAFT_659 [Calcarisporiella thermophila]|uniref:uncharacterized protein n=1 Tax=Calcarisporiella thermophila TaxID=911321 RepID=UPI003743D5C4